MKKTNFLKGLAAVVLGCMFTSCEKEDLNATFQPGKAYVNLTVEVKDGLTGKIITEQANITVDGNFVEKEKKGVYVWESETDITSQTPITITAKAGEAEATVKIIVDKLKRGGEASYNATLILAAGLKFTGIERTEATSENYYATFNNLKHDANHTHDGYSSWYVNKSDYFQPWTVTYTVKNNVVKAENFVKGEIFNDLNSASQTTIMNVYESWNNITAEEEVKELSGKASAWSYFNVRVTRKTSTTDWTVTDNATNKVAATYEVKAISGTKAEPVEFAAPGHESHYQHGHGHGHGNNSNAGGGISIAE